MLVDFLMRKKLSKLKFKVLSFLVRFFGLLILLPVTGDEKPIKNVLLVMF
jgi:hypothetical protein